MQDTRLINHPALNLEAAEALLDTAVAEAHARQLALSFAVVDPAGHLIAFRRMDGASLVTVEAAQGKARTAALLRAPSSRFSQIIDQGRTSMLSMPGLLPVAGGVPVFLGSEMVAAIGVSGTKSEVDEEIAQLAAGSLR